MNSDLPRHSLNRRRFLRGVGTAIALPLMESLRIPSMAAPAESLARSAAGAPVRSAFFFFPNGAIPAAWWPKGQGAQFEWSPSLEPLASLRDSVQILGGLDQKSAEAGPDGAGDHARGNSCFLTGVRLKKSATDLRAGVSIDQLIAQSVGHLTRFPSLELTCDNVPRSGACDSGYSCAYQFNISWSSQTTPRAAESNPRLVFERLFGEGAPGERQANLIRRQKEEQSILDFVLDDAHAMRKRLGGADRNKLDQYLTGVREIEARIVQAEKFGVVKDPGVETPAGIPADHGQHLDLMFDMLALAFQSDLTRVATLLMAHDGSNRSFDAIGISEGHHDLTHHQNRKDWIDKVSRIDRWYVEQFANFLKKLDAITDPDGSSLLHNSMIVYGSGNADANRHTHSNLPVILAGGGGGSLCPGRYVKHESKPLNNLFLTMAQRLGIRNVDRFGDSTGVLGAL